MLERISALGASNSGYRLEDAMKSLEEIRLSAALLSDLCFEGTFQWPYPLQSPTLTPVLDLSKASRSCITHIKKMRSSPVVSLRATLPTLGRWRTSTGESNIDDDTHKREVDRVAEWLSQLIVNPGEHKSM